MVLGEKEVAHEGIAFIDVDQERLNSISALDQQIIALLRQPELLDWPLVRKLITVQLKVQDLIMSFGEAEQIGPFASREFVIVRTAIEKVITSAPEELIITVPTAEHVVSSSKVHGLVGAIADHLVGGRTAMHFDRAKQIEKSQLVRPQPAAFG